MRFPRLRSLLLTFLVVVSFILTIAFSSLWDKPVQAVETAPIPTLAYTNGEQQVLAPDWSQITWSSLPPIQTPGWIQIPLDLISKVGYDPSRVWSAGQTPDSFTMLGDVEDAFHLEAFNLKDISGLSQLAIDNLNLNDFGLIGWQTAGSLIRAMPDLGNLSISEIEPILDLFAKVGIGDVNGSLLEALQQYPELGKLALGELDLTKYALTAIPGLESTPLGKFPGWQQSLINQVPGLNAVPFSQFPLPLNGGVGVVGIADVVWSAAEHGDPKVGADYFISGSVNSRNATVPVSCEAGKPCAYLELSDPAGANGFLHGKRWASGDVQKVKGGFGVLSKINDGWEPAGKLVYGPAFKVVLTKTNESKATADFGLYLRFCARGLVDLGCSPYFIGPIPWIPVQEKGAVIVAGANAPSVDIPSKYQDQIAALQQQYDPQANPGGMDSTYDGCVGGVTGDAVNKAIAAAPSEMRSYARKPVPLIMAAAKKYGVTDPAQIAYILSTVQTETTMGANLVEGATRNKSAPGSVYYGRGLVQLTGIDNYRKASRLVGVDLVKNPERAAEPEIAAKILVVGMRDGMFTGRKLSDYIRGGKANFVGARQIVNDSDKQYAMARDAQRYLQAIKSTNIADLKETGTTCGIGQDGSGQASGKLRSPVAAGTPVTSDFGPRHAPTAGASHNHKGVDLGVSTGTSVKAADGGTVIYAGSADGYGNVLIIDHGNGVTTRYAHLQGFNARKGQKVSPGQQVARAGSTGVGTGSHLHFEVRPHSDPNRPFSGQAVNPQKYVHL